MDKYKKIKSVLIAITCVCLFATVVSLVLFVTGKIPADVNRLIVAINTLSAQVLIAYNIWYTRKTKAPNTPTYQLAVQIVGKRIAPPSATNPLGIPQDDSCFITFLFPNGGTAEMNVTVPVYISFKIGQHGLLTYTFKDSLFGFVNFQPISSN